MATYSRQDRLAAAQKAGFPDPLTAVSVSLAEFGENRDINVQSQSDIVSGGVREPSFGPWQIHLPSHPDVTQSCAMDLTCSTKKAFDISSGGTDFSPWSAFTSGAHLPYLKELADPIHALAASGDTGPAGPSSGGGDNCRPLNWLELWMAGKWNYEHVPLETIARNLNITVSCLGVNAGRGSSELSQTPVLKSTDATGQKLDELGQKMDEIGKGFGGLGAALSGFQKAFRSENLWRAAFIIVGAGAVFIGGRMYLHNDAPEVVAPSGDGSFSTEAPTAAMRNRGVKGTAGVS